MNEQQRPLVGVIGTAGRDPSIQMTLKTWEWMVDDFRKRLKGDEHLVSGGAAWADHLAVYAFNKGWVPQLTLHLPATFTGFYYLGERRTAGAITNHYHNQFREITGVCGLLDIGAAIQNGAHKTEQKITLGMRALFMRNSLIAEGLDKLYAYTFKDPTEGGTGDTWKKARAYTEKIHIQIPLNIQ